jgi:hypothetical protein
MQLPINPAAPVMTIIFFEFGTKIQNLNLYVLKRYKMIHKRYTSSSYLLNL